MNLQCLNCDAQCFKESNEEIEQDFRGETFYVNSLCFVCEMCGWRTLTPDQCEELRRRVADAYRLRHGLLTSSDIKWFRKKLRMSQVEFAKHIGVGRASIKRWETWLPQEKSSDELLRLKRNEMNLHE